MALDTAVKVSIDDKHLPIFLRGRQINVTTAKLVLRTSQMPNAPTTTIAVDGSNLPAFASDTTLGGLWSNSLSTPFGLLGDHTLTIVDAGNLALASPPTGDASAVDESKLLDVMLYVEYQLS